MRDPFKIDGPTCLSFSGGSTSGYMLRRTLDANTPEDIARYLRVAFANTGCEHEKTLEFVRDCENNWGIPIEWVEYRDDDAGYALVNFETASRNGEPFEAIIRKRKYLPNPVTRFCTSELKIRTMHKRLKSLGWHETLDGWDQFIGIRADEPRRVSKIRARGVSTETVKESMCMPLADAGVGYQEVDSFWEAQPFKLNLPRRNGRTTSGNCVLCFLKPAAQILSLVREEPKHAVIMIRLESTPFASKPSGGGVPHRPPNLRPDGRLRRRPGRHVRHQRRSHCLLLWGLTMQREHIPLPIVFMDDDAAEARFEEQYLRDLATLDRIDRQNECFFVAMGELHHNKALQIQQEKIGEGDAA